MPFPACFLLHEKSCREIVDTTGNGRGNRAIKILLLLIYNNKLCNIFKTFEDQLQLAAPFAKIMRPKMGPSVNSGAFRPRVLSKDVRWLKMRTAAITPSSIGKWKNPSCCS